MQKLRDSKQCDKLAQPVAKVALEFTSSNSKPKLFLPQGSLM